MFELIDRVALVLPAFLLTFVRLSGLVMVMPILSYPMITNRVRIALAFLMSFILFPLIEQQELMFETNFALVLSVMQELLIGLMLGLGTRVIFESINWAGAIIGRQMGIAMANVMDPTSTGQMPIISQFWLLVVVAFFFAVNGHHMLFETLYRNFIIVPVGTGVLSPDSGSLLIGTGATAFSHAFQFAAPAIVFLLMVDTAIAFTARIMPQMNIFMVTLPLKIATGLLVLIISLDMFEMLFDIVYQDMQEYLFNTMHALKGA
ncbi:MAG: flagellar biosynthetic protein FliR [Candidatus Marinimicrobia bacterium]|nr:flagellar biosynthetic protein FliR [Candidatus Neomarinimicrobiota bacterium]